jgi:hypothetical protein
MANQLSNTKDIKYLNKDFADLRSALVEYAKAYYPTAYNDFTTASPGSMFIDMAAYVGDIMSFYLDNQIQETFLQYAKQKENLYTLAYMLGYRPKVTSAAATKVDVYQTIPALDPNGTTTGSAPDWRYALIIREGMEISAATGNKSKYYIPEAVDFSVSSSANPTDISVYQTDASGVNPISYLLKKSVDAISGEVKKAIIATPADRQKFYTTTIADTNIIEIIDVVDSDGNRWYEVPYLAQDYIIESKKNTIANDPNYANSSLEVPYLMQVRKVPRRFVTRFSANGALELQFGSGYADNTLLDQKLDNNYIPDAYKVGMGTIEGRTLYFDAFNPANFVNTQVYGIPPYATELTVTYLVGGGAGANVGSNQLNTVNNYSSSFYGGLVPDTALQGATLASIAVNNPSASSGGGDGDSLEEIRLNTLAQFPAQMRAVTEQDYFAVMYTMPAKFGQIAKAYITKDITVNSDKLESHPELADQSVLAAYVLTYDLDKKLVQPSTALLQNLKTHVSQYRMMTDSINLRSAYVINVGIDFEIIARPDASSREVLANCIMVLQDYFNIDKWQINQPIILSDLYTTLDRVVGVQTVKKIEFYNLTDADGDYSQYGYDISGATSNGVIYPSLDPSIFEIKFLNQDIFGRAVSF